MGLGCREEAKQADLITYVNTLPKGELAALTSKIEKDVLEAMEVCVCVWARISCSHGP